MPDIKKYIRNPDEAMPDEKARKLDLSSWTRKDGERIAAQEGVEMTEEHWRVIEFLRDHYREHGQVSSGRKLAGVLDDAFEQSGGSAFLHKSNRIAALRALGTVSTVSGNHDR